MNNFDTALLLIPLVSLMAASWLFTWLHTRLPIHAFEILRALGWRRNQENFWTYEDWQHWTREDWEMWLNSVFALQGRVYAVIAEGLSCRHCLSWHATFWMTLVIFALRGLSPHWFLLTWWASPWLVLYIVKLLENYEHTD